MVVVTDRQWRTSDCPDTYGATSANIASAPALAIGDTAIGKAVEMLGFAPPAPKYVSGFCSPQLVVTRNGKRPSVITRLPVAFLSQTECHGYRLPTDMPLDTAPAAETPKENTGGSMSNNQHPKLEQTGMFDAMIAVLLSVLGGTAAGVGLVGQSAMHHGRRSQSPISAVSTTTAPGRFESPARSSLGSSLAGHHHSCSTRVSVIVASASLSQGPVLG
jgi:hypothetical protein